MNLFIVVLLCLAFIAIGGVCVRIFYENEIAAGRLLKGAVRAAYQEGHRDGRDGLPDQVAVENARNRRS